MDHFHRNPRDLGNVLPRGSVPHTQSSTASAPDLRPANLGSCIHTNLQNGSHHTAIHALFLRGASNSGSFQLQHAIATPARHHNPPNMAPSWWFPFLVPSGTRRTTTVFKTLRRTSKENQKHDMTQLLKNARACRFLTQSEHVWTVKQD
ncbi:uncharacterized protein CLUP02_08244 [Colletotrichum lupini]|uniref:Uncharacterized protein n=1 Tax=Colletotrichum lupini TaxID=145971 RepID=A0A9Q8SSG7_9PEZI|nr:uncharacterized protein CLUP02_08244 [Colletotrichum lupini]UQC82754.1 hypothetical protein CLUP02_08244 [Colletotrichum lupini]